jgi:hypothetical protein
MNNKAKIYKIYSPNTNKIYIGSTKKTLNKRLSVHKYNYNQYLKSKFHYISSFKLIKFNDCKIELLEEFIYNNKKEILEKERLYIENNIINCVNLIIPTRTIKEWKNTNKFKYQCLTCKYKTCDKKDYKRHLLTIKHYKNNLLIPYYFFKP